MLQFLEAVENLSEINRLFLIFVRRDTSRIMEGALIDACKQTAGLCSQYPRPEPALKIALSTGLLARQGGSVKITELGHLFVARGGPRIDLSQEQGILLVACLLDDRHVNRIARAFLSKFQIANGRLLARRSLFAHSPEESLLCRTLQEVGALEPSGAYVTISSQFERLFEPVIVCSARLSQEELLKRLERQRQRGDRAEAKILELERARLTAAKRADLAKQVCRISLSDVSAGYDISSFEHDGVRRFIEVKSSVGSLVAFQWSEGEREKARAERACYFIYFVPLSFSLPLLSSPIVILQDPIGMIDAGILLEEPCGYKITSQSGRSEFVNARTLA